MARKTRLNGDVDILALQNAFANVRTVTDAATLNIDDAGGLVIANKGTAFTVTIPADADVDFEIGTRIAILQGGAGAVTLDDAAGATLNCDSTNTKVTNGQYSMAFITKYAANTWVINGELVPA